MQTVTVLDTNVDGTRPLRLERFLDSLSTYLTDAVWSVVGVEATGSCADTLYSAEESKSKLSTTELRQLAAGLLQVIEGEFIAHNVRTQRSIITLRAVDGQSWDVSSNDRNILDAVKSTFSDVRDVGDVGY